VPPRSGLVRKAVPITWPLCRGVDRDRHPAYVFNRR
jgi:hypothetical protein